MRSSQLGDLPEQLVRLGFPETAVQIYARLVTGNSVAMQELSWVGDPKQAREGLHWLYVRRLIAFRRAGGKNMVYAVDPGLDVLRLTP